MSIRQRITWIVSVLMITILAGGGCTGTSPSDDVLRLKTNFLADPDTACFFEENGAVTCLDRDGWHVYFSGDIFWESSSYLEMITQCTDGRIFLNHPFFSLEGDVLTEIPTDTIDSVSSVDCDKNGGFWVVHYQGVSHFDGRRWTHYPANEYLGSGENVIWFKSLTIAPNGDVWVATEDSLAMFDRTSWQVFEKGKGFDKNVPSQDLVVDSQGTVWGMGGSGLYKYDGTSWTSVGEVPYDPPMYMAVDDQDRLWFGSMGGILVYDPKSNELVMEFGEGELSDTWVKAMQFDHRGRLWVITDYGINIFDGNTWTSYLMHNANLSSNSFDSLVILGNGPELPEHIVKQPGSVSGHLTGQEAAPYANRQVEICLSRVYLAFTGATPCSNQAFHKLTTLDGNGNFHFEDIPVGDYVLMVQVSRSTWGYGGKLNVAAGQETQLGDIPVPTKD